MSALLKSSLYIENYYGNLCISRAFPLLSFSLYKWNISVNSLNRPCGTRASLRTTITKCREKGTMIGGLGEVVSFVASLERHILRNDSKITKNLLANFRCQLRCRLFRRVIIRSRVCRATKFVPSLLVALMILAVLLVMLLMWYLCYL